MTKAFVGLSCTGHDGALAIMQHGIIRFAEAAERHYQKKFAINQAPDEYHYTRNAMLRHLDADEIVLAKSWSTDAGSIWRRQNALLDESIEHFTEYSEVLRKFQAYHLDSWNGFLQPNIDLSGHGTVRAAASLGKPIVGVRHYDHHLCHAAFAAYGSPFRSAAVAVLDGQGEGTGTAFWHFKDGELIPVEKEPYSGPLIEFYASLGLYYGIMVCLACGFEAVSGEEWKIMGLAPYGRLDEQLYRTLESFYRVDGLTVNCTEHSLPLFLGLLEKRVTHKQNFEKAANYAYTFQKFYSDIASRLLTELHKRTGEDNLVLTGGCALNSSYNGRLTTCTPFKSLYVPSAPADDGNAVGAAILASRDFEEETIAAGGFQSPYLGSDVDLRPLEAMLDNRSGLNFRRFDGDSDLTAHVGSLLANGSIIAWMQGRAEFGPRALGNRSILADPRDVQMKARVNGIVKFRESFRPFAPAILDEYGDEYFHDYQDSPYMERTLTIRPEKRSSIPAVCHADHTGRLQSVTESRNPRFYRLIKAFHDITGIPVLMNTSLNVMGRPIVHSIEDALITFLGSQIDHLVIDRYVISKHS
ncbi:carbamoyltransferase C-terminal domain-containing protein [Pseudomonas resinovorans]|uniref:carbamoyltransferase family protein n=1 Tax=Metapseudomonas resinovorans TaxID=53412 RepID=UPI00237FB1D4|nr:carbamoyltransferase C-terminal domain-containing protein [Pseudomonas resinovorans]MDE3738820.1 carbamoyltransferase C-terminal domain-containing protein [Pseudomonas resinovorans]